MRQFGILIVIVGVGYLFFTQGLPKWEEHKAAQAAAEEQTDQSLHCVNLAQGAVENFTAGMGQFSTPPVDQTLWGSMLMLVGSATSAAETACTCPSPACSSASAALHEMRGLINDLDRFVRDAGTPVTDAHIRLEQINRLLTSALTESLSN